MSEVLTEQVIQQVRDTSKTYQQIADDLNSTVRMVRARVVKNFSKEFLHARKVVNYSKSKQGDLNPMMGKTREKHHNYLGVVADGRGYNLVLKPTWWTGRDGSKHIFQHHLEYAVANGLTEIPKGFVVHHTNYDKLDNDPTNLIMMTPSQHVMVHAQERGSRKETCNDHSERK